MYRLRMIFALLLALSVLSPSLGARAQTASEALPGIVVTGTGQASEPAVSATLQFLVGPSGMFGGGAMVSTGAEMEGTPVAADEAVMIEASSGSISQEQIDPFVDALVAAGANAESVVVTIPAVNGPFGPGGPEAAEVRVNVTAPTPELQAAINNAARSTASSSGLTVLYTGASYEPADCTALTQEARDASIADAAARAASLATSLGVTLGELVQASETPLFGSETGSCLSPGSEMFGGPYGPGTLAPFEPRENLANVTVQVTLVYAFEPAA